MKTDELRHALTDLSGDDPDVDDAFRGVTGRARTQRNHFRLGLVAALVVVIVGATIAGAQLRSNNHQLTVRNPAPVVASVSDFTWSRIPAPFSVNRITTDNGQSFALGSSVDVTGTAAIAEINANNISKAVNPTVGYDVPPRSGGVNDLAGIPGALIAVGRSAGSQGNQYGDAWRSTDGGHTWHGAAVQTGTGGTDDPINRVVVSDGVVYAIGTPSPIASIDNCPVSIWKSSDGTDYHLTSAHFTCGGQIDATTGPAGVVITTSDNATAWTENGDDWSSHRIPTNDPDPNARVMAVAADSDGYVAVGSTRDVTTSSKDSGGAIWWSPDGGTWTQVATALSPENPKYIQAEFTGVAHTDAGWIAVGWQLHPGGDPASTDAIVWTSPDGRHWTPDTHDGGVFEQYARADGVGPTTDGFAIFGEGNITGTGAAIDPIRQDDVLWLGSPTAPSPATGIIEGTMYEVGGPAPGLPHAVTGSAIITAADGQTTTVPVARRRPVLRELRARHLQGRRSQPAIR